MEDFQYGSSDQVMHQCGGCRFSSPFKQVVQTHMAAKCPGAKLVSQKCTLHFVPLGQGMPQSTGDNHTTIAGNNNTTIAANQVNVTVNISVPPGTVWAGSAEETQALEALFKDPETITMLAVTPPEEIPAQLLMRWKGDDADPRLRNIRVAGDKIAELRGPDNTVGVPRTKYVKRIVHDMLKAVMAVYPGGTPDPDAVTELQNELGRKDFAIGRKRRVSRMEAAAMHASGAKDVYGLDAGGRSFLHTSDEHVDKELDTISRAAVGTAAVGTAAVPP